MQISGANILKMNMLEPSVFIPRAKSELHEYTSQLFDHDFQTPATGTQSPCSEIGTMFLKTGSVMDRVLSEMWMGCHVFPKPGAGRFSAHAYTKVFRVVLVHRSEHRMGKTEMLIQLHAMTPNCHWQFERARSKRKVRRLQHLHQIATAMVLELAI